MKRLLIGAAGVALWLHAGAVLPEEVRWHNEATDTIEITRLLTDASKIASPTAQGRVGVIARKFIGKPYVAHTLEGDGPEMLTINVDEIDCTTFVETVLALARTVGEGRTSWRDYIYNLETMRYRGGRMNGYATRLHYISDWIIDNNHRGNLTEMTDRCPRVSYIVKNIDFMSEHRDSYAALKDEGEYQRIVDVERGYRSHRFPYVKGADLGAKEVMAWLQDGDVVALTTKVKGLDVSHLGFVVKDEAGVPHLLHASSVAGKVVLDPTPLADYFKRNRGVTGVRVIRLKD